VSLEGQPLESTAVMKSALKPPMQAQHPRLMAPLEVVPPPTAQE
jgi:hypothetical protein